jgi:NADPH:quinone reductase-like Zn-dependent oxidoreductase
VRNHAVGLNFKDVLISMGIVEGSVVEGDGLGCESAGVVGKVGPDVEDLAIGDRCIVFASGAFATSLTTSEKVCVKIPDSLSFTDAASMATVYCTVIYSVIDKARLEKNQVSGAQQLFFGWITYSVADDTHP